MTTPKDTTHGAKTGAGKSPPKSRVQRAQPERTAPIRASAGGGGARRQAPPPTGGPINEQIAQAVRAGYDVIAENIQQGRDAAERFRQGDYNIRDVPDDVQTVLQRLLQLARELSVTTFDVCDRLVTEMRSNPPAAQKTGDTPPFRNPSEPARPPAAPAPGSPGSGQMDLAVRFEGGVSGLARTTCISRPSQPTAPQDLAATPLASRDPKAPMISQVRFEMDISAGGLIAVVTPPAGLPAGVYSGLVRAPHDDVPLGVLAVEIP